VYVFAGEEMSGLKVHPPEAEEAVGGEHGQRFGIGNANVGTGLQPMFDGRLFETKRHGFPLIRDDALILF